jgi:hypothetical protein
MYDRGQLLAELFPLRIPIFILYLEQTTKDFFITYAAGSMTKEECAGHDPATFNSYAEDTYTELLKDRDYIKYKPNGFASLISEGGTSTYVKHILKQYALTLDCPQKFKEAIDLLVS